MCGQYPSDVTDEQWQVLRKFLPRASRLGRPPIDRRLIVNAVLYLNRTGCQWRALPHDFPKWRTVYTIFRRWRIEGLWRRLHDALVKLIRRALVALGVRPDDRARLGGLDPSPLLTDVHAACEFLVRDRRLPSGPGLGGREAAEAPRIMFFIGHSAGRLDVFARPSSRSTVDRGQVMRARLQAADPGFAGAVVTRRVRGRE